MWAKFLVFFFLFQTGIRPSSTGLLNSIRTFHENQLGSTPCISLGDNNHHAPSAPAGPGEPLVNKDAVV